ncbi:MAG: iron-sulfur cluster assembly scaffold protein [Rhodospirillaceae bacterium]|nr:iron-sulfur cluster assembly scaffold protein [Rhodospirillaceae bacterium]|tara:strand:- start:157 stop:588 length:432 start_codon:yes stop_codon:yes gene_type:complete
MKSNLSEVYQDKLLAYAATLKKYKRLEQPNATATAVSRSCGSRVTVDLVLKDNLITEFGLDVDACALGSASSAIVAENILGKTVEEVQLLRESIFKMLKENGPVPEGDWGSFILLQPARDLENRHQSICLIFDAMLDASNVRN